MVGMIYCVCTVTAQRLVCMPESKQKILIAEDEKPMARALELKLARAGFDTVTVVNGQDALTQLEQDHFDLMLLDLVMPRMDGFSLLAEMKERNIAVPVIVLTNLSQEEDEKKARSLGVRDFFVKSNTPITSIVDHINNVLS